MEQILKYEWNNELIEFELVNGNVMVNATQMAKQFNAQVVAFTRNEETKKFISACLKSENSHFISIEKEEDLIISRQKSGTWMHRILALKFAAWLDPDFELWVYSTIDRILFDHYRKMEESLRRSAARQVRISKLKDELNDLPEFLELQKLEAEERQEANRRARENKDQLELFKSSDDDILHKED